MPLIFLQRIKSVASGNTRVAKRGDLRFKRLKTEHVTGIYTFSCKDLKPRQPLFNDGSPSVIFMPGRSDTAVFEENGRRVTYKSAWVCCGVIKDTCWQVPGDLDNILVLRFKPTSFYAVFNVDPSTFQQKPIQNLEDIVDQHWMQVFDKLYEKPTLSQKTAYIDAVFSGCQPARHFPYILNIALEYIEEKKGNTNVSQVLLRLGKRVNSKWLYRNFVKYIGLSPKQYISLQRFVYTYGAYKASRPREVFEVTQHSGYYDDNHFFKDFRRYTGMSPAKYSWD